jgi:hypothetical protein
MAFLPHGVVCLAFSTDGRRILICTNRSPFFGRDDFKVWEFQGATVPLTDRSLDEVADPKNGLSIRDCAFVGRSGQLLFAANVGVFSISMTGEKPRLMSAGVTDACIFSRAVVTHKYVLVSNEIETEVRTRDLRNVVAWYPISFGEMRSHPTKGIWACIRGNALYLLQIESD